MAAFEDLGEIKPALRSKRRGEQEGVVEWKDRGPSFWLYAGSVGGQIYWVGS
jgi:hypothetical protein